jgi:hypothetical protein
MNSRTYIVLGVGVTPQDIERALLHTGLAISSTVTPNIFTIDHAKRRLPSVYDATLPAMVRRQAD